MAKLIAMDHGINWMWFLVYSVEDGKIIRHYEGRHHKGDAICGEYCEAAQGRTYRALERSVEFGMPRLATGFAITYAGGVTETFDLNEPEPRFTNGWLPGLELYTPPS